jgi:hypothetical protein
VRPHGKGGICGSCLHWLRIQLPSPASRVCLVVFGCVLSWKAGVPPSPYVFGVYGTVLWLVKGASCVTADGFCRLLMLAPM